jgi:hypothetical protein
MILAAPQNDTDFTPTPKMRALLDAAIDPAVPPTVSAMCRVARIERKSWYRWRELPGFLDWFNDACANAYDALRSALVKVGYQKAIEGDFAFWRVMMERCGEYTPRQRIAHASNGQSGCVIYIPTESE